MLLECRIQQAKDYTFILKSKQIKYFQIRCPNTSDGKKKMLEYIWIYTVH